MRERRGAKRHGVSVPESDVSREARGLGVGSSRRAASASRKIATMSAWPRRW